MSKTIVLEFSADKLDISNIQFREEAKELDYQLIWKHRDETDIISKGSLKAVL